MVNLGRSFGLLPDESKSLIQNSSNKRYSADSTDKQFKTTVPYPKKCSDSCLFSTYRPNWILCHPCLSFIIFIGALISFGLLGSRLYLIESRPTTKQKMALSKGYFVSLMEDQRMHPISMVNSELCVQEKFQLDCLSQKLANEQECIKKECCWSNKDDATRCFYPSKFRSYKFINVTASDTGAEAYLKIVKNSTYPKNASILKINFNYWTENMIEVKISDANEKRFEPPFPELPELGSKAARNTNYVVNLDKELFGFQIIRKSNNQSVFDTQDIGGFIFSDQLIQLTAKLPSDKIYGLGQQRNKFLLDLNWTRITLFNHDGIPEDNTNLYGSHPFYLAMEPEGSSSGVLLLNSNAMDILLSPTPAITYRTTGGILDFFIFLGPSPAEVLRQYTWLVGRPSLPPYWSLGFHLCRYGYKTLNETINVWNRTRAAKIPFDTQWNDLDYMESANDFTYDKRRFAGLPDFVDLLHKQGMHYMIIVDPGVSAGELPGTYPPFDQGISQGVFVMDSTATIPFVGKVWNKKSTVFVDFFKPAALPYWLDQLRSLHNKFAFDGAWIDMNDPSNFLDGTKKGCPNTTLNHPPYLPAVVGNMLYSHTLCMSARHYKNEPHYNLHNVYGLAESIVTNYAMQQIRNKRAFVISRSSFPGLGKYAGVWTGDITSTWDDMAHTISDILSFSLFGIPMSGADICGFAGNTSVALCQRWSQLGAFYPFSRNHNSERSTDQDPVALGPEVVEAARSSLLVRYSLLPYLYTLFWHAHTSGDTVARPMFVEFPKDNKTLALNSQFLWGPALLIVPVLQEGATNVTAYLPAGQWYDFYTKTVVRSNGTDIVLPAPLDTIPLMLRGGFIVPTQKPELTTTHSRSNPVDLLVALNENGQAYGDLYWDDGESLDYVDGAYNFVKFSVDHKYLRSTVSQWPYTKAGLILGDITILGVEAVAQVIVSGKEVAFTFNPHNKELLVTNINLDLSKPIELKWK